MLFIREHKLGHSSSLVPLDVLAWKVLWRIPTPKITMHLITSIYFGRHSFVSSLLWRPADMLLRILRTCTCNWQEITSTEIIMHFCS